MTEKLRASGTIRLWSAVASQADRAVTCHYARRSHVMPTCHQAKGPETKAARLTRRVSASSQLRKTVEARPAAVPSTIAATAYCLPTLPLEPQARAEDPAAPSSPPQEGSQQPPPQLWQRFVLSRKTIAFGAGLGASAALVLWSGGLLAGPALHLAGFGVAGAKAGTVAAAATLGPTLAAGGVCAAACQGAVGGAAVVPLMPLMSNAVLSAAGGSMLGGAGAASMALLCMRGLADGGGSGGGQREQQGQQASLEEMEGGQGQSGRS